MTVFWWSAGILLIVLSFILWVGGLRGKEGMLRIGKAVVAEPEDERAGQLRPVNICSIVVGIVGILAGFTIILLLVAL